MKKFIGLILLALLTICAVDNVAEAQCAMCRATVENNISAGTNRIGSGLNTGILYLMSIPYVAFVVIAYFWYKQSKAQQAKRIQLAAQLRNAGIPYSGTTPL
ncbi:MAG: hypothetical protein RMJ87_05175 [Cytophagales bacterium]|nr:hypothetical protein [Bernardetiaceae bacterium]MDW8204401.1 hypothetical protein [Cytophagales bacterium]